MLLLFLCSLEKECRDLFKALFFAALEKNVYRFRACDSPAKAASRFFSVWLPLSSRVFMIAKTLAAPVH